MKNISNIFLSFFLSLLFMISTTGVNVIYKYCLSCDGTDIQLYYTNSCCCNNNPDIIKYSDNHKSQPDCCENNHSYHKLITPYLLSKQLYKYTLKKVDIPEFTELYAVLNFDHTEDFVNCNDPPVINSANKILSLIQQFRL